MMRQPLYDWITLLRMQKNLRLTLFTPLWNNPLIYCSRVLISQPCRLPSFSHFQVCEETKHKRKSLLFNFVFVHLGSLSVCTVSFPAVKLDCDCVCDSSAAGLAHCSESSVPRSRPWLSVKPSTSGIRPAHCHTSARGEVWILLSRCHLCSWKSTNAL